MADPRRSFLAGAVGVVLPLLAAAALPAAELHIDPATSRVTFTLKASLHTVHGTLPLISGEIRFPETGGPATGTVVFDATRSATGNGSRDRKMHGTVLETGTYPRIVVHVSQVTGTLPPAGEARLTIHGTVSIHGGDHPVTIEATVHRDGNQIHGAGSLVVPFVRWGMKDPSVFLFRTAKEVTVHLDIHGTLTAGPGGSS